MRLQHLKQQMLLYEPTGGVFLWIASATSRRQSKTASSQATMASKRPVRITWIFVFVFHCVSPYHCADAVDSTAKLLSRPRYQTFYADAATRRRMRAELVAQAAVSHPTYSNSTSLKMEVVHRNMILKTMASAYGNATMKDTIAQMIARDSARVKAIQKRLAMATGVNMSRTVSEEAISAPVVSGLTQGSGEYFASVGLGTPATRSYLIMDTGSDLSWVQCSPCQSCYKQSTPIFQPSSSSSFKYVSCTNALCKQLEQPSCSRSRCQYEVLYGDGSSSIGDLARDTLGFTDGNKVTQVVVGCGHRNEGLFDGASGLLGLGAGTVSLPSLLRESFSYCLPHRSGTDSSTLIFGSSAVPNGAAFTSMERSQRIDTFYYVDVRGISVGGERLEISTSVFSLGDGGNSGVIMDSGTTVTRLASSAYRALRKAFSAGLPDLPKVRADDLLDTCFRMGSRDTVNVPTVYLHLAGDVTLELPTENYLLPLEDAHRTVCLAFGSSGSSLSIIGNILQQGYRVSYDNSAGRIGFAARQC
ncbi:hypothetical protein KP509_29G049300 [Ceratopteris richardii]|uniref:Peptidase A1 domain-containing protein n=1 Tax=Ceratopteris richardii TaxID=49495 RepID=A0A8T2R8H0_CERRI|nr:hypothetical protein KP509_29G049300 [Ceratopteris richardii]